MHLKRIKAALLVMSASAIMNIPVLAEEGPAAPALPYPKQLTAVDKLLLLVKVIK